ncbi:YbaK/EbsC family protein [Candidatus Parcubacteria bacterium]|nr:YbaK/EbsC family protein [Candidatus Parcubacteria bacterium]
MPVKKTIKKKSKKVTTKLPAKLVKYLEEAGIDHEVLEHRTVYTALDAAATMKKKMNEIAKALYVKADKDYYVVVLPADQNLDFPKLAKCLSASSEKPYKVIKIPGEKIMLNALKIKKGAVSAFGNMHKLPVAVDKGLIKVKKAAFGSGSFNHSVEMAVKDFIKLEKAIVGSFGKKKVVKKQKVTKSKRLSKKKTTKKKK